MPRTISAHALARLVGSPDCPIIVDVRRESVFAAAPTRIASSIWRDHRRAEAWAPQLPAARPVVVACAHGHNVSALAAAQLRAAGREAFVLEGGIDAYEQAGGAVVANDIPGIERGLPRPSVWVTRERPKVDRIACPWLIRRFVDRDAVFHFVPSEWVAAVADELGATPFDVEDVRYTHRGDGCSFDTMLEIFGLADPALHHLARIVRGADTARLDLEPEAAGLLALSLGLSAIEDDDLVQLERGMAVYDALHGWCRHARHESHNWPKAA